MFVPLDDLSQHTEEQRQEYYKAACVFLGVPTQLNLLKWFWSDNDSGKRSLILYATRGATDLIRADRSISVKSLEQHDGDGYVSFTATGEIPSGRMERASGVAYIGDKKGVSFENALKKAQTEALRRMTLQFAGGGFLDESELPITQSTIPNDVNLGELVQGAVTPMAINDAPGKDITPEKPQPTDQEKFEVEQKKLRDEALAFLKNSLLKITSATPVELESSTDVVLSSPVPTEVPKRARKPRTPKNAVTLDPGTPVDTPAPEVKTVPVEQVPVMTDQSSAKNVGALITTQVFTNDVKPEEVAQILQSNVRIAPVHIEIDGTKPTLDQNKEYRARLGKYANDVLPTGGMMPSPGIGGVTMKLRSFANLNMGLSDMGHATVEQWEEFFTFLDEYTKNKGAAELVKYIDAALGIK